MLRFELTSTFGRTFLSRRPPRMPEAQLLNVGAGTKCYPDFVNGDFFVLRGPSRRRANLWMVDLRYPLNCADDHWDGVFSEHALEHLHPERVLALLKEIRRTLKPRAWVRIVVPDVARYVDYYLGRPSHEVFARWTPRAAALRSVSQNYLHVSLWDRELLTQCFYDAGFATVHPRVFHEGADPRLLKDTSARAYESLYLEAQKD